MIDDTLSKWELTGLLNETHGLETYVTAKLLNNQAALLSEDIKGKYLNPHSTIAQLMLPLASRIGRAIGTHPKLEVLDAVQRSSYSFHDNSDIVILSRIHVLSTPVAHVYFGNDLSLPPSIEMEKEYCDVLANEIIQIYKELLEDDTVTTVYAELPIISRGIPLEAGFTLDEMYGTTYAVYRKGDN